MCMLLKSKATFTTLLALLECGPSHIQAFYATCNFALPLYDRNVMLLLCRDEPRGYKRMYTPKIAKIILNN